MTVIGFSRPRNPRAIPEHALWRLCDGTRTVEARTRMTPLGPELRLYYNGDLLRSEVPRDGREVGALAEDARRQWEVRGFLAADDETPGSLPVLRSLLLALCFAVTALAQSSPAYAVERVIDGDTVALETIGTVRLIGVDTPETVDPRKPVQAYGLEAAAFLRSLLEGQQVRLEYDWQRVDKYQRTLAYLYLADGTFVNLEIVRQGFSPAYTTYPFRFMEEFRAAERRAREEGRGLWAPPTRTIRPAFGAAGTQDPAPTRVWVNTSSRVYHCPGTRYYGNTKRGEFMTEAEARQKGHRPAYGRACGGEDAPDESSPVRPVVSATPAVPATPALAADSKVFLTVVGPQASALFHADGCPDLHADGPLSVMTLADARARYFQPHCACIFGYADEPPCTKGPPSPPPQPVASVPGAAAAAPANPGSMASLVGLTQAAVTALIGPPSITQGTTLYYDRPERTYQLHFANGVVVRTVPPDGPRPTPTARPQTAVPQAKPPSSGPTARCKDGTYSYSQSRSGTCSGHGGVAAWLR